MNERYLPLDIFHLLVLQSSLNNNLEFHQDSDIIKHFVEYTKLKLQQLEQILPSLFISPPHGVIL